MTATRLWTLASLCCLASPFSQAQEAFESLVAKQFSGAFAVTAVLTDSEVITFGVMDFNPNEYFEDFNLDDDQFGNADTLDTRGSVQIYTLPWSWDLSETPEGHKTYLKARLGYIGIERDSEIEEGAPPDTSKHRIYDIYGEYGWEKPIAKSWRLQYGAGLHLMHYNNSYYYRNATSRALQPVLDGTLVNTGASAVLAEPLAKLLYDGKIRNTPWSFQSSMSYSFGHTIKTESDLQKTDPLAWRWTNGAVFHFHLPELFDRPNQLRALARRVDLGGDVVDELDAHYYYEFGLGWLWDTKDQNIWLKNIGLGLSLNVGSSLSGGSVVLLYNEDY